MPLRIKILEIQKFYFTLFIPLKNQKIDNRWILKILSLTCKTYLFTLSTCEPWAAKCCKKSSVDLPYPGIQCLRCGVEVERGLSASHHNNCWQRTECRNIEALCISARGGDRGAASQVILDMEGGMKRKTYCFEQTFGSWRVTSGDTRPW